MKRKKKNWMEKNLEEPFLQVETYRCEIMKQNYKEPVVFLLAAIAIIANLIFI